MPQLPFFGASYESESPNLSADTCVNLYPEVCESGQGAAVGRFRGTPGYRLFDFIPAGPVRGLWSGEGRLFVCVGDQVYEIGGDGSGGVIQTFLGNVDFSADTPVQFFANGTQLMVVSNNHVYVSDGGLLSEPTFTAGSYDDLVIDANDDTIVSSISLPFDQSDKGMTLNITSTSPWNSGPLTILSIDAAGNATLSGSAGTVGSTGGTATETPGSVTARSAAFLDTYGIVAPAPHGSPGDSDYQSGKNFYISAPNDFTSWNAIDVGVKESYPDNILALQADHEVLYVFGDLQATEVFSDTGNANFPFERVDSGVMHFGLAAQYSVAQLGVNGIAWLAWSSGRGNVQAFYAQSSSPQRISTHALESIWRTYPTVADCEAYSYIEDGHHFWVLNFVSGDATWVYDFTASQQMGKPMWHRRGVWDEDAQVWHRQRGRCHAYGYLNGVTGIDWPNQPVHFVGDYETGNIYVQDLSYGDANHEDVVRQRAFGHVGNDNKRTFWSHFELLMETDSETTATLDYSRDRGHTFENARDRTVSAPDQRLRWTRLGASRDRVFRLTITGQTKVSLINTFGDAK